MKGVRVRFGLYCKVMSRQWQRALESWETIDACTLWGYCAWCWILEYKGRYLQYPLNSCWNLVILAGRPAIFSFWCLIILVKFRHSGVETGMFCTICRNGMELVFKGSVHRTAKNHRMKLNQSMDWSICCGCPNFGAIPVAGCWVSKIFENRSKTGFNWLQLVEWSHVLHTLVAMFISFNLVFCSSKMVKNWEKYTQIHFCLTCTRMTFILTHSNFHHFGSFNFWISQFQIEKYAHIYQCMVCIIEFTVVTIKFAQIIRRCNSIWVIAMSNLH